MGVALFGYCLGPHAARYYCHCYSYIISLSWSTIQQVLSMYLFGYINQLTAGWATGSIFRASVWARMQEKVTVISILVHPNVY